MARARAVYNCGTAAKEHYRSAEGAAYIAAVMYQFRFLPYEIVGDNIDGILLDYRTRLDNWLQDCVALLWQQQGPLDLSEVAMCIVRRGRQTLTARVMYGLRAVLVLHCAPFGFEADPGIMRPEYQISLCGPGSRLGDRLEVIALPPLFPWV